METITRTSPGALNPIPIAADLQQQPVPQQQYPQQAPLDTGSGQTLVLILCVALLFAAWRKSKAIRWPLAAAFVAGILLSGSVIGPMVKQTAGSAGTQMENMVNGFGAGGTISGTGTP